MSRLKVCYIFLLLLCPALSVIYGVADVGDYGEAPEIKSQSVDDTPPGSHKSEYEEQWEDEKIFLNGTQMKYYIDHPTESPIQYVQDYGSFDLSGYVWRNVSRDQTRLLNAFHSVAHLEVFYQSDIGATPVPSGRDVVRFSGSAFFISPKQLLTARHTIKKCKCGLRRPSGTKYGDCVNNMCPTGQEQYKLYQIHVCQNEYGCMPRRRFSSAVVLEQSNTGKDFGWHTIDDAALLEITDDYKSKSFVSMASMEEISSDPLQVIIIGYPYTQSIAHYKNYAIKDGSIQGLQIADFFSNGGSNSNILRKAIAIGNTTKSAFKETMFNDAPTWGGVSGGLVVAVGQEHLGIGIHVGGSVINDAGNTFITTKHPFVSGRIQKNTKDEL
eukprot:192160_1